MQSLYISELYTTRTNIFNIIICHKHAIHKNSKACPARHIKHDKNYEYLLITFYWKSAQQAVSINGTDVVKCAIKYISVYQQEGVTKRQVTIVRNVAV